MIIKVLIVLALIVFAVGLVFACITAAEGLAEGIDEFRRK